jgi:hypothetical protein
MPQPISLGGSDAWFNNDYMRRGELMMLNIALPYREILSCKCDPVKLLLCITAILAVRIQMRQRRVDFGGLVVM